MESSQLCWEMAEETTPTPLRVRLAADEAMLAWEQAIESVEMGEYLDALRKLDLASSLAYEYGSNDLEYKAVKIVEGMVGS